MGETSDEVLEEYKDQGSILIDVRRVSGLLVPQSYNPSGVRHKENVPKWVVKQAGCYTQTRLGHSINHKQVTHEKLASIRWNRKVQLTRSSRMMRRSLQRGSA